MQTSCVNTRCTALANVLRHRACMCTDIAPPVLTRREFFFFGPLFFCNFFVIFSKQPRTDGRQDKLAGMGRRVAEWRRTSPAAVAAWTDAAAEAGSLLPSCCSSAAPRVRPGRVAQRGGRSVRPAAHSHSRTAREGKVLVRRFMRLERFVAWRVCGAPWVRPAVAGYRALGQ